MAARGAGGLTGGRGGRVRGLPSSWMLMKKMSCAHVQGEHLLSHTCCSANFFAFMALICSLLCGRKSAFEAAYRHSCLVIVRIEHHARHSATTHHDSGNGHAVKR